MPGERSPCPHSPDCAGCAFSGLAYGEQLRRKHARVVEAFGALPRLASLVVPEVIGSPRAFGYRNQAKLVARRARRGLLLGVYRPGTHQVVDISRCAAHHPLVNDVLRGVRGTLERWNVPVYDERSGEGWLRYVVVRVSSWKRAAQLILVVRDRGWERERHLLRSLRALRHVSSIVLNVNAAAGNVIFGERFAPITREAVLVERVGGLQLASRAGAFLQANIPVARRVYERVLEWADPHPEQVAVDLYCGVGAISFSLASRARSVWGIEESAVAVLDAKANIRRNGFHNVRFIAGEAGGTLAELRARVGAVDLITLNPPRKGASEAVREEIVGCAPARIVYVSCDPRTLARDLDWFAARGYPTERVQPFDMLPQTDHVECVARLARAG